MTPERRSVAWMVTFVALWAGVELLASFLVKRYSGFQIVWMRYGVHLVIMIALFGRRSASTLWRTNRIGLQIVRSLLMLGMPGSFLLAARMGVDTHTVWAVFWLSPLVVLALSHVVLHESARPVLWIITVVVLGAVWIVEQPHRMLPFPALLLALAMAMSFAVYVVLTRALRHESIRANLTYTALGVFVALTPAMPSVWVTPGFADLMIFALIGGVGLVALYALDRSASAAPVAVAAPIACLQAVFVTLAAWNNAYAHAGRRIPAALMIIVAAAIFVWFDGARLIRHETS